MTIRNTYVIIILSKGKPNDNMIGKNRKGGLMQEVMTDYQFKSIVKMILRIVKSSKDIEEITKSLEELLKDKNQDDN